MGEPKADVEVPYHEEVQPLVALEDDCRLLGSLLDDALKLEVGPELFSKIEQVRTLSSCAFKLQRKGDKESADVLNERLMALLEGMHVDDALPVVRACGHYLNLTGIAETYDKVGKTRHTAKESGQVMANTLETLLHQGFSPEEIHDAVSQQHVEIVLTAHPTQVHRRTLQHKFTRIAALLKENDAAGLTADEKDDIVEGLVREITSIWQTDELRRAKPSPLDEARGGLHVVEQSMWHAVPNFLRKLSRDMRNVLGRELPINARPVQFGSWMGGDRDGNPNVTAAITRKVAALSRWRAADLYLREIEALRFELSMSQCSDDVWQLAMEAAADEAAAAQAKSNSAALPIDKRSASGLGANRMSSAQMDDRELGFIPEERTSANMTGEAVSVLEDADDDLVAEAQRLASGGPVPQRPHTTLNAQLDKEARRSSFDKPDLVSKLKARGRTPQHTQKRSAVHGLVHPEEAHVGAHPYRMVLSQMKTRMQNTRAAMEAILSGSSFDALDLEPCEWYRTSEGLLEPLLAMYWSLWECGGGVIADGRLLDLLRRVYCFDMTLMKLDVRQESGRHADVLDAITVELGMGSYKEWAEDRKVEWLVSELQSKRPLVPHTMRFSEDDREVLDTMKVAAELGSNSMGAYVISMASQPSDVLAVELLQREARVLLAFETGAQPDSATQRVVPLFETLDDLDGAGSTMDRLFSLPWYRAHVENAHGSSQEVMLGYSDSGKDAGRMAAAWALYKTQETLVDIARKHGVRLALFHGRGGTIGRGGGPLNIAMQSQPPGSVDGCLRITEQGEMIQAKFGMEENARLQLENYTTAVLSATLSPPQPAKDASWRAVMEELSKISCEAYRSIVFRHPRFIDYYRAATPEAELANLNIGSRPARRNKAFTVGSIRAIPWIFSWSQTRLLLPSWLGIGEGLQKMIENGHEATLQAMYQEWPLFQSTINLVEMILTKVETRLSAEYDKVLVTDPELLELGALLRARCRNTAKQVLVVSGHRMLCEGEPALRRLIQMRNPHLQPINMLQIMLLKKLRDAEKNEESDEALSKLRDALMVSINGIAAGMRNTG